MDSLKVSAEWPTYGPVVPPVPENASNSCSSTEESIDLKASLDEMQGLICYLLRKNQQLRMELSAAYAYGENR
jgi:hypothetical protein